MTKFQTASSKSRAVGRSENQEGGASSNPRPFERGGFASIPKYQNQGGGWEGRSPSSNGPEVSNVAPGNINSSY